MPEGFVEEEKGKPRLLVIDDEEVMCNLLKDLLSDRGYEVDYALTGEEGLKLFKSKTYDVTLTDLRMPGIDGIEVMREIKRIDPDNVVIVITGYGALETAQEALRLGAYDYIAKPFEIDAIAHIVKRGADSRRLTLTNRRLMKFLEDQNVILDRTVKERTRHLQLLYDIGKEVSSTLKLSGILQNLVDRVSDALALEVCTLLLVDEVTGEFTIRSSRGLDLEIVSKTRLKLGEGVSGWVALKNEAVMVDDLAKDPRFMGRVEEKHYSGSHISVPVSTKEGVIGVINVSKKKSGESFTPEDFDLLKEIATEAGIAIENAMLYRNLQEVYLRTVTALVSAIDAKDQYTRSHSESVSKWAVMVAKEMNLPPPEIETIRLAGQLHDVGKIGVRDQVLTKPGKLTEEEWTEMKLHSTKAAEILGPLDFLKDVAGIVKQNHERWDGKGYPDGLKGEEIRLGARIMAVADAYDTMVSKRPYREVFSKQQVIEEFKRTSGTQFDPKVVEVFLKVLGKSK